MDDCHKSATKWQFRKVLNAGAFGSVSWWYNPVTEQSVAIKKCSINLNEQDPDQKAKTEERWLKESALISELRPSDHIVRSCAEICRDLIAEQNQHSMLPVIAMEYCDGGNLRQKLELTENINGMSEYDVCQVLFALKEALSLLHKQYQITHRDIKPENVVIKTGSDGNPIYKLADMGYARGLNQNTIEGSLVGTRNYFAPEIVREGEYRNSVDYWSMGVVAFEIMCGVYPILPFHPNAPLPLILESIRAKPPMSIAVTKSMEGALTYHYQLFKENRLSGTFRRIIVPWLQTALEADGRKRGFETTVADSSPQLTFFSRLDQILQTKIVTIFWLNRAKFLSFIVDESMTMQEFYQAIEKEIDINRSSLFFVPPAGHKLQYVHENLRPVELYESKFLVSDKPMMYLIDFETDELVKPENPFIPEMLLKLFNTDPPIAPHYAQQTLMNTLFLFQNEYRRMRAFVDGSKEYMLLLEDELVDQSKHRKQFESRMANYEGQVMQHMLMAQEFAKQHLIDNSQVSTLIDKDADLNQTKYNLAVGWRQSKVFLESMTKLLKDFPMPAHLEGTRLQLEKFENDFRETRRTLRNQSIDHLIKTTVSWFIQQQSSFFHNAKTWVRSISTQSGSLMDISRSLWVFRNENIVQESHLWWQLAQARMQARTTELVGLVGGRSQYSPIIEDITEDMEVMNLDNVPFNTNSFDSSTRDLLAQSFSIIKGLESLLHS